MPNTTSAPYTTSANSILNVYAICTPTSPNATGYTLTIDGVNAFIQSCSGLQSSGSITVAAPGYFIRQGAGTPPTLSNLQFEAWDTQPSYIQSNVQNLSNNAAASSDHIVTADTGTDSTNYGDFGINSSGWAGALGTFNHALGVYMYAQSADLAIGTVGAFATYLLYNNTLHSTFNATGYSLQVGGLNVHTVGQGLAVAEGANAKQGSSTLVLGTVTVANTSVTANSRIFLEGQAINASTAIGNQMVSSRVNGTSFTITSYIPGGVLTQTGDLSTIAWIIFEPGV